MAQAHLSLEERLAGHYASMLEPVFADLRQELLVHAGKRAAPSPARQHAEQVLQFCQRQRDALVALKKADAVFQSRFNSAADEAEQSAAIIDFARTLGANEKQLRRDQAAPDSFFHAVAVRAPLSKGTSEH